MRESEHWQGFWGKREELQSSTAGETPATIETLGLTFWASGCTYLSSWLPAICRLDWTSDYFRVLRQVRVVHLSLGISGFAAVITFFSTIVQDLVIRHARSRREGSRLAPEAAACVHGHVERQRAPGAEGDPCLPHTTPCAQLVCPPPYPLLVHTPHKHTSGEHAAGPAVHSPRGQAPLLQWK